MNRRLLLKMLAATSLSDVADSVASSAEDRILELDCIDLLARIRDGSFSVERVCARFLQQYERQRSLNVCTWIDSAQALSQAREIDRARGKGKLLPALAGLPILIKDNIDTVGSPTSAGSAALKNYFPSRNAPVVEQLLRQGAIVMGKANMQELAAGPTSSNPTFGFVRNPYNPRMIPGGSSGGSAAAIASRIVPVALGTDTAGSMRIPAAYCGVVGLRPSTYPMKLYSPQGVVPLMLDGDTIGPMGRSVADVALLHGAILGQPLAALRTLENSQIGVPKRPYWEDLDPEVERVAEAALVRLRDRGARLVEIDMQEIDEAAWRIYFGLASVGFADVENFLREKVPSISLRDLTEQTASRDVRAALEAALLQPKRESNPDLLHAQGAGRDALRVSYRRVFEQHGIEALIFPTAIFPPPPIREGGDDPDAVIEHNGRMVPKVKTIFRNTVLAVALGAPALSLPAGLTRDGLPVGLELDGLPGDDHTLLSLARAAEGAIGRLPAPPDVVRDTAVSS